MQQLMNTHQIDFEELGYQTMLETRDDSRTKQICGFRLHEYETGLEPEIATGRSALEELKNRDLALQANLYDRPMPVNDAAMLVHSRRVRIYLWLAIAAGLASLSGNFVTFYLFEFGILSTVILAVGITGLALVAGYLAYEYIVVQYKPLQLAVIVTVEVLFILGLLQLGQARQTVMDKAAASETATSYVDEPTSTAAVNDTTNSESTSEPKARKTLGTSMMTLLIAADLVLGILFAFFMRARNDEDYAAWIELKKIREQMSELEQAIDALFASVEIAKSRCMAGILRAQGTLHRRRPPYYKALGTVVLYVLLLPPFAKAQNQEQRLEGILIDTSSSISKDGGNDEFFREYLSNTKKLLLTEPANSRVWVSVISVDSFGGVRMVMKGWTPEAHGVFTDNLVRARHQLAMNFETKSSEMSAQSAGTDIIGGLWDMKTVFESSPNNRDDSATSKTIWIFSDMVNETPTFYLPGLIENGPERTLARARAKGLLVPLKGYKIHVSGASTNGLTPDGWLTIKEFWRMYFAASGAELVSYSSEADASR